MRGVEGALGLSQPELFPVTVGIPVERTLQIWVCQRCLVVFVIHGVSNEGKEHDGLTDAGKDLSSGMQFDLGTSGRRVEADCFLKNKKNGEKEALWSSENIEDLGDGELEYTTDDAAHFGEGVREGVLLEGRGDVGSEDVEGGSHHEHKEEEEEDGPDHNEGRHRGCGGPTEARACRDHRLGRLGRWDS